MKRFLLTFISILTFGIAFAQDIIVTKEPKKIEVKILKINNLDVKYTNYPDTNGVVFSILQSNISSIIFQNGNVKLFDVNKQNIDTVDFEFNVINDDETVFGQENYTYEERYTYTRTAPKFDNINDIHIYLKYYYTDYQLKNMLLNQKPQLYAEYRKGQKLNAWGVFTLIIGAGSIPISAIIVYEYGDETPIAYSAPVISSVIIGGGITMVSFGQKYKRKAINNFAEDIYNGKAHLTKNSIKSEFNINFTGNGMGLLVNF